MTLQHHFVVVVENGEAYIESDVANSMFWDGTVWNTDTQEWEANYENEAEDTKAYELLRNALANVEWADIREMTNQ
jgi:hypothetical protein